MQNILVGFDSATQIGHVYEYPTMHYFGNLRHALSMKAYMILTEYSSENCIVGMLLTCPITAFTKAGY